jgi:glycerol uptake facilitator protein
MLPEMLAEFIGTFVLVLVGDAIVAMVALFGTGVPGEIVRGGFTNITIGWGLAVMMGTWIAGRVSGAHLNPAVSIALAIYRDFPWRKVAPYCLAQTLGALAAAALVYWNYLPAFQAYDPALDRSAAIFTTFPSFPQVPFAGLLDQTIGTALFLMMILALADQYNDGPGAGPGALIAGLGVTAIGMAFGGAHGYAINPAADFGPRLFTVLAGFRNNGLSDGGRVFWIPIAAPILGGIIGSAAYEYGIRRCSPGN